MTTNSLPPRVLIAHRYFWPENLSTYPLMLRDIVEWHVAASHDVTILTATASTPEAATQRRQWAEDLGVALEEVHLEVDRGRGTPHRLRSALRFSAAVVASVRKNTPDAMSIASYPTLLAPLAMLGAGRRRVRTMYWVQDILAMRLSTRGGVVGVVGRGLLAIERLLVRKTSLTVTLTEDMKQTLGGANVAVLQNFLLDSAEPLESQDSPSATDLPTLVYAGNFGRPQNLPFFIEAASRAYQERPFRLRLVGDGSERDAVVAAVERAACSDFSVEGPYGRDEADAIVATADVGIVASEPLLFRSAFPSKSLTYLREGLQLLVLCEDDIRSVVGLADEGLAFCAPADDPDALVAAIADAVGSVGLMDRRTIRQRAEDLFGRPAFLSSYRDEVVPAWFGTSMKAPVTS